MKAHLKCDLQKVGHFVSASLCQMEIVTTGQSVPSGFYVLK